MIGCLQGKAPEGIQIAMRCRAGAVCVFIGFLGVSIAFAGKPVIMQSQVKGLLVIELPDGSHAGGASQMNATAIPEGGDDFFRLRFNQNVGEMMTAATQEVEKLMRVRHADSLPMGNVIEFGFADKHSPKDGPSAAVACALMAESIITGVELDQKFAVTGDITATGEVRPVGGVEAKLRGAARKDCEIFAVPVGNKSAIDDMYVLDGIDAVSETQVILVETFEEALRVGRFEKEDSINQAVEDFKLVSKAIRSNPRNASHPKVVEKLKTILKAIPRHESAMLVALHGSGQGPQTLSLQGSLNVIEKRAAFLSSSMKSGSFMDTGMDDPLWENLSEMKDLRRIVDVRTKPYLDSFLDVTSFLKQHRGKNQFTAQLIREFREVIGKIDIERQKLVSNRDIQEELMDE